MVKRAASMPGFFKMHAQGCATRQPRVVALGGQNPPKDTPCHRSCPCCALISQSWGKFRLCSSWSKESRNIWWKYHEIVININTWQTPDILKNRHPSPWHEQKPCSFSSRRLRGAGVWQWYPVPESEGSRPETKLDNTPMPAYRSWFP